MVQQNRHSGVWLACGCSQLPSTADTLTRQWGEYVADVPRGQNICQANDDRRRGSGCQSSLLFSVKVGCNGLTTNQPFGRLFSHSSTATDRADEMNLATTWRRYS